MGFELRVVVALVGLVGWALFIGWLCYFVERRFELSSFAAIPLVIVLAWLYGKAAGLFIAGAP